MENILKELSKFSLLFALIAAVISGILANILASLAEKVAGEHPRIKALNPKKQLCLVSILFVIFSLPSIYQQFVVGSTENKLSESTATVTASSPEQVFRVEENSTINLFDDTLSITLVRFECFLSTQKEMVIGSPGFENLTIESIQVGNSYIYEGKKPYEIRVVKLDSSCSWVEVQAFELSEFPKTPKYTLVELKTESLTVNLNKTGFAFDGKLSISVTYATGNFASAVIGSSGFPNKNITQERIGYILEYEAGDFIYNVRILEITSYDNVKFQITKFQKKLLESP